MQMKLRMAIYTVAAVFLKCVCNALLGTYSVPIFDLLTMWLVSLLFAMFESAVFPENAPCTTARTLVWLAAANLCFIGGVLLAAFLELALGLMWFGDRFVLKMDSEQLTRQLQQYQQRLQK